MRLLVFALAALGAASSASAAKYVVYDLGVLSGNIASLGFGYSSAGYATGYSYNNSSQTRGFLWSRADGISSVGTLGGTNSQGLDVNRQGTVVGFSNPTNSNFNVAFRKRIGFRIESLGTLGGNFSEARGINSSGVIVGTAQNASQSFRAFRWREGFAMENLGTFAGISTADDINDSGVIVGGSDDAMGRRRAFRWIEGRGLQDLGVLLGHNASSSYAINGNGEIVGYSSPGSTFYAFIWRAGQMSELVGLFNYDTRAYDINLGGDVVGRSWLSSNGNTTQAVIWPGGGAVQNLNNLLVRNDGWVLKEARAIANDGKIVGWGERFGQTRAFLLEPVPQSDNGIRRNAVSAERP